MEEVKKSNEPGMQILMEDNNGFLTIFCLKLKGAEKGRAQKNPSRCVDRDGLTDISIDDLKLFNPGLLFHF